MAELTQAEKDAQITAIVDARKTATKTPLIDSDLATAESKARAQPVTPTLPPTGEESPQGATCTPMRGNVLIGGHAWSIAQSFYLRYDAMHLPSNWPAVQSCATTLLIWNHELWYQRANEEQYWSKINHTTGTVGPKQSDPRGTVPPVQTGYDPKGYLTIATAGELATRRSAIVNAVWEGRGIPTVRPTISKNVSPPIASAANRVDKWETTIAYNGKKMFTVGYAFRPSNPSDKAAILMPGHNDNLWARNFDALTRDLLTQRVTVVMQGMILWAAGNYSEAGYSSHDQVWDALHSPAPFIDHYLVSVNQLASEFTRVGIIGLSGGGWASTLCAATDPRIALSYDVAGSQPLALWTEAPAVAGGDLEQFNPPASYEDLYLLGSVAANRRHVQGCNVVDIYFPGTKDDLYKPEIAKRATALNGAFAIHRYNTGTPDHTLDASVRAAFIADL